MDNPEISSCCSCTYKWKTDTNGSHSCAEELRKLIKKIHTDLIIRSKTVDGINVVDLSDFVWNEIRHVAGE